MIDVVGPEGTRTLIRIFSNTSQNTVLQKCAVASLKEFSFSLCATYCFSFTFLTVEIQIGRMAKFGINEASQLKQVEQKGVVDGFTLSCKACRDRV